MSMTMIMSSRSQVISCEENLEMEITKEKWGVFLKEFSVPQCSTNNIITP